MSDTVIRVENLGKRYTLTHEQRERYTALRDVLTHKAKRLTRKVFSPLTTYHSPLTAPSREDFWALKDVSFEIHQGDRVGIIGRNGAGKTTLLRLLSRITEPSEGRIMLKGRVASLLEVGTGFHPELTGRENIYLNGAILGMTKQEIKSKFDEIVDFAEIEKFLDTPVKRYSSGMYVRLAFAVAAHLEPEILLVDEVLAVGDAQFQKKCLGKMEDVSTREGRTVLFVSHNMGAVRRLCVLALLLNTGSIAQIGRTSSVVRAYESLSVPNGGIWNNSVTSEGAETAYLARIEVLGEDGKPNTDFLNSEAVRLQFTLQVRREERLLKIGFDLVKDGTIVFRCEQVDSPAWTKILSVGTNRLTCTIPPNLLHAGEYDVVPVLSVHCLQGLCSIKDPVLRFRISLDSSRNEFHTVLNEQNHPGLIFPMLHWENS